VLESAPVEREEEVSARSKDHGNKGSTKGKNGEYLKRGTCARDREERAARVHVSAGNKKDKTKQNDRGGPESRSRPLPREGRGERTKSNTHPTGETILSLSGPARQLVTHGEGGDLS